MYSSASFCQIRSSVGVGAGAGPGTASVTGVGGIGGVASGSPGSAEFAGTTCGRTDGTGILIHLSSSIDL